MKKLCYVATIPAVVHAFLRSHIQTVSGRYDVTVICNSTDKQLLDDLNARLILLPIERKYSPLKDIQVLFLLFNIFRRERFDIVHSMMPKTGMLAMFAAWLAGVPIRIHTFTGQVWVTKHGVNRFLLKWFDKLIGKFASYILVDSLSQRDFLIKEGVLSTGNANVIGAGSTCGVDPLRFHPDRVSRQEIRDELGIAQDSIIILFVGRFNRDKGILDLAVAFNEIAKYNLDIELLLVGTEEDVPFIQIQKICHEVHDRINFVKFTPKPEHYMMAADIFCLPSYREGLPMTILESAACAVPSIASHIYGITDAVEDGRTGLLFPAGDVTALTQALLKLIDDRDLRLTMGETAQVRVLELFSSQIITSEMLALYSKLLSQH